MKTLLKQNIYIEGFDEEYIFNYQLFTDGKIIYQGKTSEIDEELAKECVDQYSLLNPVLYWNYGVPYPHYYTDCEFTTAKDSIQSACSQKFCIIYKEISNDKNITEAY